MSFKGIKKKKAVISLRKQCLFFCSAGIHPLPILEHNLQIICLSQSSSLKQQSLNILRIFYTEAFEDFCDSEENILRKLWKILIQ